MPGRHAPGIYRRAVEARHPDHPDRFFEERVRAVLADQGHAGAGARETVEAVAGAALEFAEGAREDDVTIVAIRRVDASRTPRRVGPLAASKVFPFRPLASPSGPRSSGGSARSRGGSPLREREEVGRRRALQGEGEEFVGHRPYRIGDDLRHLDGTRWRGEAIGRSSASTGRARRWPWP